MFSCMALSYLGLIACLRRERIQKHYGFGERSVTRMADVQIEDPDVYRKEIPVDNRGRVTVGKEYEGKTVNVVMEVVDDND